MAPDESSSLALSEESAPDVLVGLLPPMCACRSLAAPMWFGGRLARRLLQRAGEAQDLDEDLPDARQVHCTSMSVTRCSLPLAARVNSAARDSKVQANRRFIDVALSHRRLNLGPARRRSSDRVAVYPEISGRPTSRVYSMGYARPFKSSAISDWYSADLSSVSIKSRATPGSGRSLMASQIDTPEWKKQAYPVVRGTRRDKQDYRL